MGEKEEEEKEKGLGVVRGGREYIGWKDEEKRQEGGGGEKKTMRRARLRGRGESERIQRG